VWRACIASVPGRPWRRGGAELRRSSLAARGGSSSERRWLCCRHHPLPLLAALVVDRRLVDWLRHPSAAGFLMEQFFGGYWWCVSAFTPNSEDEGHPLPAVSVAPSRCSSTALAQVVPPPKPVQQPRVELRLVLGGGRLRT
jgi:hypothetical protein